MSGSAIAKAQFRGYFIQAPAQKMQQALQLVQK